MAAGYGIEVPYLEHDGKKNVHISAIDSGCMTWVSGLTINEHGGLYDSGKILSAQGLSESDISDANRMKKIGLQYLLALAYSPELLSSEEASSSTAKPGKRHQRRESVSIRHPRRLRSQAPRTVPRPRQGGAPMPHRVHTGGHRTRSGYR